MKIENLILVKQVCEFHEVERTFIETLTNNGLLHVEIIEQEWYLPKEELVVLEKWIRLHFDLEIGIDSLDVVADLLEKINELQKESRTLRTRLNLYE
jgi:hypothetical protein